ncbi:MAG: CDP-alcohol phosphatidyltransferase family protein [Myxococcota bacterium]
MLRYLPNAITISRGLCGPIVAVLLVGYGENLVAFWVFLLAIVTDLLDGWVARLLNAFHPAGLWLDPLADKTLTDSCWVALGWAGFAPVWLCAAMVIRDVLVMSVWAWVWVRGLKLQWTPTPLGQVMVPFEGVALCVLLFHGPWLNTHWPTVGTVIGTIALILSLISLLEYALEGPEAAT